MMISSTYLETKERAKKIRKAEKMREFEKGGRSWEREIEQGLTI